MPCNMLAVATGALAHDVSADALTTPTVVEAIQTLMAAQLGVDKSAVTMYNTRDGVTGWMNGYRAWKYNEPLPAHSAETLVGGSEMYWVSDRIAVMVDAAGNITYRDGWNLANPLQGGELATFQQAMNVLLDQLGIAIAQEKTVEAIASVASITSDEYLPDIGARVLKVQV